jgi:hypothetical protein
MKCRRPSEFCALPEGKSPLGRHRSEDNIKVDLRDIGWGGMDWIHLAQDMDQWRGLINMVVNLRVPQNVGKFLSSRGIGGFPIRTQFHEVSLIKESSWG